MKAKKNAPNAKKSLDEKLYQLFSSHKTRDWTLGQLKKSLGEERAEKDEIYQALEVLRAGGNILKTGVKYIYKEKSNTDTSAMSSPYLTGILEVTRSGIGFVTLETGGSDVRVPPMGLGKAFDGDLVKVKITRQKGSRAEGEVIQILERKTTQFSGEIRLGQSFAFLEPDNDRIHIDFFIPPIYLNGAREGDKVIVEILDWPEGRKSPEAKVINVLGKPGNNNVEMQSILVENGFPLQFSPEAQAEAENIPFEISAAEIKKRKDFRKIFTITIDPTDAKDFDDALSFQVLKNGDLEVGVHIADVDHFVRENSHLDEDAFQRATSVYLVDRVLPMLPEKISNHVCSLRPHEEKCCFSVVFVMNSKAEIKERWFGRTVIYSDHRFTYDEAQEVIEEKSELYANEIRTLHSLACKLRARRYELGSISFELPEVKFKLDENAVPIDVYVKERKEAHLLIEDFMLLANKEVAFYLHSQLKKNKPGVGVYRVHDVPDPEKLENFRRMASRFGYDVPLVEGLELKNHLNRLFNKILGKPEHDLLAGMAIRSMAKAAYTTNNIGHFGLGFDYYSHFTSPIRRYPDLMTHRLLARALAGNPETDAFDTEKKCLHTSKMERQAQTAERSSVKYKQVEFLQGKIGHQYEGVISGVTNFGMFVEIIDNKCEGLIRLQNLTDDTYFFDEIQFALVGYNRRKIFRLGDPVLIIVAKADLAKRELDFELIRPEAEPVSKKNADPSTKAISPKSSHYSGKRKK